VKFLRGAGFSSVLSLFLCLLELPAVAQERASSAATATQWAQMRLAEPLLRDPIWVYNDWSAYDELSDNIPPRRDQEQGFRISPPNHHTMFFLREGSRLAGRPRLRG
jgi:hypothetical protein